MSIVLWVVQGFLALLAGAGGATKAFKFGELAKMPAMAALPPAAWKALGVVEMVAAVLVIVPGATGWMRELTAIAAGVLAVESLGLAALYGRHSRAMTAANPLVWSLLIAVLAAVVAVYGR